MNNEKRFLIVDDDEIFLFTASYALKKSFPNVNIETAKNGKEGLEKLQLQKPDALFLDINMPVMNGWELLDELTHEEPPVDYPVLMVSSSIDPADKQKALEHQFKPRFIEKPLSEEKVKELELI